MTIFNTNCSSKISIVNWKHDERVVVAVPEDKQYNHITLPVELLLDFAEGLEREVSLCKFSSYGSYELTWTTDGHLHSKGLGVTFTKKDAPELAAAFRKVFELVTGKEVICKR
jgi:hypothetical protein